MTKAKDGPKRKTCARPGCKRTFTPKRPWQEYHRSRCKIAHHREIEQAKKTLAQHGEAIAKMASMHNAIAALAEATRKACEILTEAAAATERILAAFPKEIAEQIEAAAMTAAGKGGNIEEGKSPALAEPGGERMGQAQDTADAGACQSPAEKQAGKR